jgi:hypothetical protein
VTSPEAATPQPSDSPLDLIGKTVRWEDPGRRGDWFTALVLKRHRRPGMYYGHVLDTGTFFAGHPDLMYKPGDPVLLFRDLFTVIDSEPVTEAEECE